MRKTTLFLCFLFSAVSALAAETDDTVAAETDNTCTDNTCRNTLTPEKPVKVNETAALLACTKVVSEKEEFEDQVAERVQRLIDERQRLHKLVKKLIAERKAENAAAEKEGVKMPEDYDCGRAYLLFGEEREKVKELTREKDGVHKLLAAENQNYIEKTRTTDFKLALEGREEKMHKFDWRTKRKIKDIFQKVYSAILICFIWWKVA